MKSLGTWRIGESCTDTMSTTLTHSQASPWLRVVSPEPVFHRRCYPGGNHVQASYVEYITPALYDGGSGFAEMNTMRLHISLSHALGATVLIAAPRTAILGYPGFIGVRFLVVTFERKD